MSTVGNDPTSSAATVKKSAPKPTARYPDYHDHMDKSDEWIEWQRQQFQNSGAAAAPAAGGVKKKFPMQLYRMLEAVDGTNHSLIVRWLPHGRAFVVLEKTRFEKEVLPLYFPQQSRYASFQRQLNIYGFLRQTRDDEGYYHELFLRSRSTMAAIIPRESQSRYAVRQTFDPGSEPDFYAMPWLPDVSQSLDGTDDAFPLSPLYKTDSESVSRPLPLSRSVLSSSRMTRPVRAVRLQASAAANAVVSDTADTLLSFSQRTGYTTMRSNRADSTVNDDPHFLSTLSTSFVEQTVEGSPQSTDYVASFALNEATCRVRDAQLLHDDHSWQDPTEETTASGALEGDDMGTICPESPAHRRATKVAEWADFLRDVDFETSSSSSGEKKKRAL